MTARSTARAGSLPAQWASKNAMASANCSGSIPISASTSSTAISSAPTVRASAWTAKTLYFADTGKRLIYAYDYETATGAVRSRRIFTSFESLRGLPDGATVDSEGYLWSTEIYSGRLIRFDNNGVVDRIIGLPVQSTTS